MQILNKTYQLNGQNNISPDLLRDHIRSFWFDVFLRLHNENPDFHLNLMCKVGFFGSVNPDDSEYKTVAKSKLWRQRNLHRLFIR